MYQMFNAGTTANSSVMETRNHSKNGANLKSHTSKKNFSTPS